MCSTHNVKMRRLGLLPVLGPKPPIACKYVGCEKPHYAKGACQYHWLRERRGIFSDADMGRRRNGVAAERNGAGQKQCNTCELWLDPAQFMRHKATSDSLQVRCKQCTYIERHRTQYGLSRADIARILHAQDHKCAICLRDISRRYVVDHDHACCPGIRSCGKCVRGFLCDTCNLGIGAFQDDTPRMQAAVKYIRKHRK
jgi:hypothetical protein